MKNFENIATVIKKKRQRAGITQLEFAKGLGYKQGQFISNVERSQCSIPVCRVKLAAEILDIDPKVLTTAMQADYAVELKNAIR